MIECLLCLTLALSHNTYQETLVSDFGFQASIGDPFYAFGSYEKPSLKKAGQSIGSLELPGAGIGYRYKRMFFELGYYWPSNKWDEVIEHEIVRTVLVQDHGERPWHHKANNRHYELEPGWGGRVGVSAPVGERFSVFAAYRFLALKESLDMCSGGQTAEDCWDNQPFWQNRDTLSLSSVQIGFSIRL